MANFKSDPTSREFTPIDPRLPVDYLEPIDENQSETLDLGGIANIPREAIAIILRCLLPDSQNPCSRRYWESAVARLCATCHALAIDPIRQHPLSELATHVGCSRALLSIRCVTLRDFASLGHSAGRSEDARKAYSNRAKAVWKRREITK